MKIEILGMGCARCHETEDLVRETVKSLGLEATITSVQDIKQIMGYGVMTPPAVVIDGVVKVAGRIPRKEEIAKWLKG
ncbi:MAG: hypothetical protein CSYNP_00837 [Syntrophus sp. SKADARSKE-3]|nr:hypothetical protein [Syntrophus sp. SKADARSKE-3]